MADQFKLRSYMHSGNQFDNLKDALKNKLIKILKISVLLKSYNFSIISPYMLHENSYFMLFIK